MSDDSIFSHSPPSVDSYLGRRVVTVREIPHGASWIDSFSLHAVTAAVGDNRLIRHLRQFYAADLLIKLYHWAGFMCKVPKVFEESILAAGGRCAKIQSSYAFNAFQVLS